MGIFKKLTRIDEKVDKIHQLEELCAYSTTITKQLEDSAKKLYEARKNYANTIVEIGRILDNISSKPKWVVDDYERSLKKIKTFLLAVKHEDNPNAFQAIDIDNSNSILVSGAVGAVAGGAIALGGGSAAMSIATVFGTAATTGTAISTLSGAAATNAALAWLGGGAVAAGGAGMAGGSLLLSLFGPIGIAITGISATGSILLLRNKNKKDIEILESRIDEVKEKNKECSVWVEHLNSIISRSKTFYNNHLKVSYIWLNSIEPDYSKWIDEDKYKLEKLVNDTSNMASLIVERI